LEVQPDGKADILETSDGSGEITVDLKDLDYF
jgi:hypothetical protein